MKASGPTVVPHTSHTAFAMPEWFDAWLTAFGDGRAGIWRPKVKPEVCGIPFCVRRVSLAPLLSINAAVGATNDHTPRYDVLGSLKDPAEVFNGMMSDLHVSLLRFDYLSAQSNLLLALRSAPTGLLHAVDFCEDSPYVNCDLDWDTYWTSLGSTRSLWARRERKLMGEQQAVFACLRTWPEVEPTLDAIYDVEASGWKGREGTAIKQHEHTRRFYTRCIEQWARQSLLRLFTLSIGGEIVAFQITVLYRGVLTQLKVGYDERHGKLSPGQVLQLQLLRWAFADPEVRIYDMLGGGGKAEETKRKWATDAEPLYTLRVFRRDAQGLLAWSRLVAAPRLKRMLTGNAGKTHRPITSRANE